MKPLIIFFALLLAGTSYTDAQQYAIKTSKGQNRRIGITSKNIKSFVTSPKGNVQIICPEPITYVDISVPWVQGDLPIPTICRLRPDSTTFVKRGSYVVTIVTKNYLISYKLYCNEGGASSDTYVIKVNQSDLLPINKVHLLDDRDFYNLCLKAIKSKRKIHNIKSKKYGMKFWVNNIYTVGQYIILDIEAANRTQLPYNIDQIRFNLEDKKELNAHVSQTITLKPVYQFYDSSHNMITKKWRNIFVFKKFTYPGQKLLNIEMTENQISGRKIDLNIKYNQILKSKKL